jgi:PAS domain S-box-containing protein
MMFSDSAERKAQANRQHALADAAVRITASLSVTQPLGELLQLVCDAAAQIIGAHLGTIGMTLDGNWGHAIQAVTLSDKYSKWRTYDVRPNGTGIYSIVCKTNRPMRLTEEELIKHPAFRGFSHAAEHHPALRGWLCVPLVGRDGRNLGALHLADKYDGEFTEEDQGLCVQLATMAAVAIDNHNLYGTLQEADRHNKELVASLRANEQQFHMLADSIPQLAWMADSTGWIFWYNQRWFDYTGSTLEEMQGWGWEKVHHPEHVERVVKRIRRSFETGDIWEDTFPLRGRDGSYRWFLSRAIPIHDDHGKVARWFGSNTDVTDQRNAEEALRDADRRKDQFLAMLGHELRNPLTPILMGAKLLSIKGPPDPKLQEMRDMIVRQTLQMTRLVDDLLDVGRITVGKVRLQKEHVELKPILDQAIETCRPVIERHQHTLAVTIPAEPLFLTVDAGRIAQVVCNLLNNAAKYMEDGGTIQLTAKLEGRIVVIAVRDKGIGIAAAMLPRVFDSFVQVKSATSRADGGFGVGLWLARSFVQMHDGTIEARSDGEGAGSEFVVRLPATGVNLASRHTAAF